MIYNVAKDPMQDPKPALPPFLAAGAASAAREGGFLHSRQRWNTTHTVPHTASQCGAQPCRLLDIPRPWLALPCRERGVGVIAVV